MRLHQHRRRGGSGENNDLPLHRLPDRDRLGLPRLGPDPRDDVPNVGSAGTYLKTTAESGHPRLQAFCPRCGSPIYSTTPGEGPQPSYMVRVGILRQRREFVPKRQNWFRSALPWVTGLGAVHRNEKQA
jgi:hypothetical protein